MRGRKMTHSSLLLHPWSCREDKEAVRLGGQGTGHHGKGMGAITSLQV